MIPLNNRKFVNIIIFIFLFFLRIPQSYSRIFSVNFFTTNLAVNKLANNKSSFNPNFTIRPTVFKSYGPLFLDMNNIKYKNKIFFIPTLNDQSKPLFLAVYCPNSLINVKGSNGWKGWRTSFYSFENNIVETLCRSVDKY